MKKYPITFKFSTQFDLVPSWMPHVLQDWIEESRVCDITAKRVNGCYGSKTVRVIIEASSSGDLEAKRRAFNAMIEAKGYGPGANKK